jgi:hypothetical protein
MVTRPNGEYLNCPFCDSDDIQDIYIRDGRQIVCCACGCSVNSFQPDASSKALAKWNTRSVKFEEAEEVIARKKLDEALDKFVKDVRDVIQYKVNDSISVDEVLKGIKRIDVSSEKMTQYIVLGWVQRMIYETLAEDFDEKYVAQFFDNSYYQIGAQHIGPEDFSEKAKPYDK